MTNRDSLRKLQVTVLIKQECKRLEYRVPSDLVISKWELPYCTYVLGRLKSLGTVDSADTLRSKWVEYRA